ncbi:hypothetical protein, partial [Pseudomonas syringae]|uniref:hypothetical protein n=1 Tax=Pseudomonas syringae TaxID=317 RepID=UPI0034D6FBA5
SSTEVFLSVSSPSQACFVGGLSAAKEARIATSLLPFHQQLKILCATRNWEIKWGRLLMMC